MLKNERGEWINSTRDTESHIVNHFCDLFKSFNLDVLYNKFSYIFTPSITKDDNAQLTS